MYFSFHSSTDKPYWVNLEKGLGRMAVLIRARHELDPDAVGDEKNILTSIIRSFRNAFTLDISPNRVEEENPVESRDEDLLAGLIAFAGVCGQLRSMRVQTGVELQDMMRMIVTALRGFNDDGTRFKQWLEMDSTLDVAAQEMMMSIGISFD
ncbi:MAG: hypothetical protein Q9209_001948 [Squamulea sp. 1 TL-2023]